MDNLRESLSHNNETQQSSAANPSVKIKKNKLEKLITDQTQSQQERQDVWRPIEGIEMQTLTQTNVLKNQKGAMPLKELITTSVKQFLDTQKNPNQTGPILQLKACPSQQSFGKQFFQ